MPLRWLDQACGRRPATGPPGLGRRQGQVAGKGPSTVAPEAGGPQGCPGDPRRDRATGTRRRRAWPGPVRGRGDTDPPARAAACCYGNGTGHAPSETTPPACRNGTLRL